MFVKILFYIVCVPWLVCQSHPAGLLSYDLSKTTARQATLPHELREISGLAVSGDGRVFAHHDESGEIFEIDPDSGVIRKKFTIGMAGDFEGLAIAGNRFYLVTASGVLYEFPEGSNNETVQAVAYSTPLSDQYDVEGLCYDPVSASLLLACKGYSGLKNSGYKAVFSFSLRTKSMGREPRFLIAIKEMERRLGAGPFRPSGIEFHPETQTYFVLDAEIRSVIEISSGGNIVAAVRLDRSLHKQPEGITFGRHGNLLISDEGSKHGVITRYRKKR
jgi:uncharacterized protein YjiK